MSQALPSMPRRDSRSRAFILLGIIGFFEMLIFLIGIALGVRGEDIVILLLALITLFVSAGPILLDMTRPAEKRQILISLVILSYVIFLVAPVFTQYFLVKSAYQQGTFLAGSFHLVKERPGDIIHAQLVALLGLTTLLLGFYLPIGRLAVSGIPRPVREWPPHSALLIALITLSLGWTVYITAQLGLIPTRAGSGALGTISSGNFFGISLLALVWLRHRSREAFVLLAIVIPLSMAINFFTGSKRLFLTPPFMLALAYIAYERRIRMSWVFAGFAALIVLYPVSQFYRDVIQTDKTRGLRHFLQDPGRAVQALSHFTENVDMKNYFTGGLQATGGRLDALGVLTVIVRDTPERVPYQGGWTIGYIVVSYVPRLLWPGKPGTTTGEWVSQAYGSPYDLNTDVGPSWMGELFFNWGYLGVAIGMFVFGILCRICHERLFSAHTIPALFGAVVVLYCVPRTVQGSLLAPINGTVYNLPPILIAHFLVGLLSGYQRPVDRPKTAMSQSPAQATQ